VDARSSAAKIISVLLLLFLGRPALSSEASPEINPSTFSNIQEVQRILDSHTSMVSEVTRKVPASVMWERLKINHCAACRDFQSSDRSSSQDVQCAKELIIALDRVYVGDDTRMLSKTQSSSTSARGRYEARSTLESAIENDISNCYSRCLLYYLHARLAGIRLHVLATPRHMLLYVNSNSYDDSEPAIYDAIRHVWLSVAESRDILSSSHCLLDESQIGSVAAFNVGTVLCQESDFAHGIPLLEQSVQLGFPFPDAIKNLSLAYFWRGRDTDVINLVDGHRKEFQNILETTDHNKTDCMAGIPDSELQTRCDIEQVYFESLVRLGRHAEAINRAELILGSKIKRKDFQLYRRYLELKAEPPGLLSSDNFLPMAQSKK